MTMVAAISTAINPKRSSTPTPTRTRTRTPLLPSESDNALAPPRRPKAREVTSRYMSSSSSSSSSVSSPPRRCHSPLVTRTVNSTRPKQTPTPTPLAKRSQSAERRRQGTPRPTCGGTEAPAAQKVLFTSTRSLSVSFQGESFSIQVRTPKPPPPPASSFRKSTPERRKPTPVRGGGNGNSDQTENSRSLDQHRWPGKSQQPHTNYTNRSLDYADSAARKQTDTPANAVKSLQNLIVDVRGSHDWTLRSESQKSNGSEFQHEPEPEPVPSDTESVTSGSSSGEGHVHRGSRGIVVPARFWQEANNRLRRQTDPPSSRNGGIGNKATVTPKLLAPKKLGLDCPVSSPRGVVNSRIQGSPIRSAVRPASPSKLATPSVYSPSRGVSPSRARNGVVGTLSRRFGSEPSVLSFAVDVPRGKVGENGIVDAHLLRLLHNRLLQWRFVNARADAALSAQTLNAEKSLYDAWLATSKLRESVRAKRTEFQLLKQRFKLMSILKDQMVYWEDWATLDPVYSNSLSGAIEALRASTLRLPIVGGAKADLLNLKDAISSAMDVMQAMASSICLLSPKVGQVNSLVVEVANLSATERVLLEECTDLLSVIETLQVREYSLRTHIAQLTCLPRSTTVKK